MINTNSNAWSADLAYIDGRFLRNRPIACDEHGMILDPQSTGNLRSPALLGNRAILPGLVNAHSHAFQRVIRGRTEYRTTNTTDSFWTWREMMYSAAVRLTPEDVYDASRMAFLEMALSGITAVGEFHYLHHAPDGTPYDDPNLLAKEVVRAANDVGLRIALLRVAYARSGFESEPNPQQSRFIESEPQTYLKNLQRLADDLASTAAGQSPSKAWTGIAPHSVRAVSLSYLREIIPFASQKGLPVHMHVAEQPAEVSACIAEHGRSPVALLHTEGLLSERFTAVHAVHVTPKAIGMLAGSGATVCACPTTERNLGDGIVPVDELLKQSVPVALGSDSHVQIDLLEDARELEYHLRLQKMERAVLAGAEEVERSAIATRLFECATNNGARSIGASGGTLAPGNPADFFTVDLNDSSIAGASVDDLLSNIVFSLSRTAVKDVVVGGKLIVEEGRHVQQEEIVEKFKKLQKRLWG
ncbi:MAG TPA: formimidoylglutamate deiminase [Pyrinomonadaceae bacterium]|nr:formimidoylglutamate deiminase [Pyrinomonadaceae bacterium]